MLQPAYQSSLGSNWRVCEGTTVENMGTGRLQRSRRENGTPESPVLQSPTSCVRHGDGAWGGGKGYSQAAASVRTDVTLMRLPPGSLIRNPRASILWPLYGSGAGLRFTSPRVAVPSAAGSGPSGAPPVGGWAHAAAAGSLRPLR